MIITYAGGLGPYKMESLSQTLVQGRLSPGYILRTVGFDLAPAFPVILSVAVPILVSGAVSVCITASIPLITVSSP
jgi:hypothetical protein